MRGLALFNPKKIALILALSYVILFFSAKKANSEFISVDSHLKNRQISAYRDSQKSYSIDQGHIIFEDQEDFLIGVFYYLQSEYYCFTGHKLENNLAVLLLPTYNDPLQVFRVDLSSLSPLNEVGTNEQKILKACRNDVIAFLYQNHTIWEASLSTSN